MACPVLTSLFPMACPVLRQRMMLPGPGRELVEEAQDAHPELRCAFRTARSNAISEIPRNKRDPRTICVDAEFFVFDFFANAIAVLRNQRQNPAIPVQFEPGRGFWSLISRRAQTLRY
eukprot:2266677-Rhodomonas_salina.3